MILYAIRLGCLLPLQVTWGSFSPSNYYHNFSVQIVAFIRSYIVLLRVSIILGEWVRHHLEQQVKVLQMAILKL